MTSPTHLRPPAPQAPMDRGIARDTPQALLGVWDWVVALGERVGSDDWGRPTPCPGQDAAGLVGHIADARALPADPLGAPRPGVEALRAARQQQAIRLAALRRARLVLPRFSGHLRGGRH